MLKLFCYTVVISILITAASPVVFAQISFEKTYGGSLRESGNSVQQTSDGGYIIVGITESFGPGEDIYLIKTNSTGDTLWTKTFGSESFDHGHAVKQTSDGGYIIAGSKYGDAYLIKTNTAGDTLWTKTFDYSCAFCYWFCNDIQQVSDGGYVIGGGFTFFNDPVTPFLIKTDEYGDSIWYRAYYGVWRWGMGASSVHKTRDGGYVFAEGPSVIKTDSTGETIWRRCYGDSLYGYPFIDCNSVQQTADGGYIISGCKYVPDAAFLLVIKTDTIGDTLWTKTYDYWDGYDPYASSVGLTSDNGYIISGGIVLLNGPRFPFLIKTDLNGDTLWAKTFGEGEYGPGYSVHQTTDGGYVFVGTTKPFDSSDIYLVKTLSDGSVVPVELTSFTATTNGKKVILNWSTSTELNNHGFEIQRSTEEVEFFTVGFVNGHGTTTEQQNYSYADGNLDDGNYYYRLKQVDYNGSYEYSDVVEVEWRAFNSYLLEQNFPNPFNPKTIIGFGIQNKSNVKITILNAIGEEVAVVLNEEREPGFHQVEFNAASLPSGVYFYRLQAGSFVETKKMLLLK